MKLFKKKTERQTFDKETYTPIIKSSICTGEQVAGFRNNETGKFVEVMLLKSSADLDKFKEMYEIKGEIAKEY